MSQCLPATTTEATPQPAPTEFDIHDASRSKIEIRPRCKEYVKKQRTLMRTLTCFASLGPGDIAGSHTASDPSSSTSSPLSQASQKENSKTSSTVTKTDEGNDKKTLEKPGHSSSATPKVVSGRVEKRIKSAKPCLVPVLEKVGMVAHPAVRYDCTCPDSAQCARCRLLALEDRYVLAHNQLRRA
ncbi:hypothetical protein LshimejAT787_0404650 [Lyophyllum shimeji]|uniref:Uncharacterized protein n=1 Tax=Lyophyllum shimeji TaxID=47721 RepID=A0A9P3PL20_LYOSH|nr:hypothetical protein LshimejAT787_0404650 [Lyophyllum shimeji]